MKKGEKFAPIITLVVYFGTDGAWDGAKCLYDLLDIDEELKEYVTNFFHNLLQLFFILYITDYLKYLPQACLIFLKSVMFMAVI